MGQDKAILDMIINGGFMIVPIHRPKEDMEGDALSPESSFRLENSVRRAFVHLPWLVNGVLIQISMVVRAK